MKQKALLSDIAFNFNNNGVGSNQSAIPQTHWERIFKEDEAHLNGSKSYTWDEVKEMARRKNQY